RLPRGGALPLYLSHATGEQARPPIPLLREKSGGNKPTAAIVAGTGEYDHAAAGALPPGNRLRDRPAGAFHQSKAGYAAGNGQSVGLSHLSIAEDLNHSRTISERLIARRRTRGTIGVDKFIGRLPSLLATPASLLPPRSVFYGTRR